jgi:hypothetical protein
MQNGKVDTAAQNGMHRLPAVSTDDRILTKSRAMEYLTLDGLTKMTGVPPHLLDIYTVKELSDNALDEAELTALSPDVQIRLSCVDHQLVIEVADRGRGLSPEMIKEITNFQRFGGTKYFVKKPTRGAQGNALMTIVGLVAALWRAQGVASPPPITFSSRGVSHRVALCLDPVLERATVARDSVKISDSDGRSDLAHQGTQITIFLPLAYPEWGTAERYTPMVEEFALWNPHARVSVSVDQGEPRLFLPTVQTFPRARQEGYGSPHWYTLDDFEKLLFANVRALEEQGEEETTLEFAKRFKGCSSNRKEFTETLRGGLPQSLNEFRDPQLSERLFRTLLAVTTPPSPAVLGAVGQAHLKTFMGQWDVVAGLFKYKKIAGFLDGTHIPCVLEVAIGATKKLNERRVAFGINGTVTYRSPFEQDLYQPTKVHERDTPWQKVTELRELLGKYRIAPHDPVMVAIHLCCPNIRYGDYGKSSFDTGNVKKPAFASGSDLAHWEEENQ